MNYIDYLRASAQEHKSLVCMGMDPVLEEIPIQGKGIEETIVSFYSQILDACNSENIFPSACKPNYAFYAQYGFEGLRALQRVNEMVREMQIPLILDAKRGDIGKTSEAYAKEVFNFWKADAVTLSPYMGWDTIQAFAEWGKKGKGSYVLARTSNPSAIDFQSLEINAIPLYQKVSEKIVEWSAKANGNMGAVIGATSIQELEKLHVYFSSSAQPIPYLIPGIGKQGGSISEVMRVISLQGNTIQMHRINSSSDINYAYKKTNTSDFAGAAVKAIKELNVATKW